jgi:hypothetical protein
MEYRRALAAEYQLLHEWRPEADGRLNAMADAADESAAFEQLAGQLRDAAAAAARGLRAHRGTPADDAFDRQIEHTLDRLALMYGRHSFEALKMPDIVQTAVNEQRTATALDGADVDSATGRARALVDAARRGVRLHVREPAPSVRQRRGVYVTPLRDELQRGPWAREDPCLPWSAGAVLILDENELAAVREGGDEVDVLFLDTDELLDLDFRGDRPALEAVLGQRLAVARTASDRVGDSPDRYLLRLLHLQSVVLRSLRDRLAGGHPSAHAALLPILAEHRALFEDRLAAQPGGTTQDPLGDAIDAEGGVQELAGRWAAEPGDSSGLRERSVSSPTPAPSWPNSNSIAPREQIRCHQHHRSVLPPWPTTSTPMTIRGRWHRSSCRPGSRRRAASSSTAWSRT